MIKPLPKLYDAWMRDVLPQARKANEAGDLVPWIYRSAPYPWTADLKVKMDLVAMAALMARCEMTQRAGSDARILDTVKACEPVLKVLSRSTCPESQARVAMLVAALDIQHRWEGRHIYEMSDGLVDRLEHTELRGLTGDDLRLPFPCIYIALPKSTGLRIHTIPPAGMYISETEVVDVGDGPWPRIWSILVHGYRSEPEVWPLSCGPHYMFQVALMPGKTLDECVEETETQMSKPRAKEGDIAFSTDWAPFFQFVMNVVLYATMPDARVDTVTGNPEAASLEARIGKLPRGEKRDRLRERLKSLDADRRIFLGRGVASDARPGVERSSPEYATRVAGHWKMQQHGPQRALRKRIWIEPYWRNLEGIVPTSVTRVV